MGVLNCTPDSFSDGGDYFDCERAVARGLAMWAEGADILDVGGESSRPGARPVPVDEELRRTIPVVRRLCAEGCVVSIDTRRPEVMRAAVDVGAAMINDISALSSDGVLACAVACGVDVCLMHMQGTPRTMQDHPSYRDVTAEVTAYLKQRVGCCVAAGIPRERILVDPGIGFGKRVVHNWQLLRDAGRIRDELGLPLLVGLSRKSFLSAIADLPPGQRDEVSALAVMGPLLAGCDVIRVHDVARHRQACRIAAMLCGG